MKLADTVEMMNSSDYKERFKAEYAQLVIRYYGLRNMLEKWDNGTLEFEPTCPRSTYNLQIKAMIDYINNEVEKRPKVLYGIENIHTGEITFNARGGAYQDKNAAYRKMAELGIKEHRLVEYKLESKGE